MHNITDIDQLHNNKNIPLPTCTPNQVHIRQRQYKTSRRSLGTLHKSYKLYHCCHAVSLSLLHTYTYSQIHMHVQVVTQVNVLLNVPFSSAVISIVRVKPQCLQIKQIIVHEISSPKAELQVYMQTFCILESKVNRN